MPCMKVRRQVLNDRRCLKITCICGLACAPDKMFVLRDRKTRLECLFKEGTEEPQRLDFARSYESKLEYNSFAANDILNIVSINCHSMYHDP